MSGAGLSSLLVGLELRILGVGCVEIALILRLNVILRRQCRNVTPNEDVSRIFELDLMDAMSGG